MLAGRVLDYRRKRNGKSRLKKTKAAGCPRKITLIPERPFIRCMPGTIATLTRSLEAPGSGRRVPIRPIRVIFQPLGSWGSTTESSCAINMFFAAAHARPPGVTRDILTEIFFRPKRSGNSRAFDSPKPGRNPFRTKSKKRSIQLKRHDPTKASGAVSVDSNQGLDKIKNQIRIARVRNRRGSMSICLTSPARLSARFAKANFTHI